MSRPDVASSNLAGPTTRMQSYKLTYYLLSTELELAKNQVSFTLGEEVAKEIDGYLRELVGEAKSGKPIPKRSNVYEEIVRKGWEVVKRNRKK